MADELHPRKKTPLDTTPVLLEWSQWDHGTSSYVDHRLEVPNGVLAASGYVPESRATEGQGGWVAVADGLPEEGAPCAVLWQTWSGHPAPPEICERLGKPTQVAWRRFPEPDSDEYIDGNVTHWMLLPPPPKGPNNG